MRKLLFTIMGAFVLAISLLSASEEKKSFEGVITFKTKVESFKEGLSTSLLQEAYGSSQVFYYSAGLRKITGRIHTEIYNAADKKIYYQEKPDVEFKIYGADKDDGTELTDIINEKSDLIINRMKTRMVTMIYENGDIFKYWYSPDMYTDPKEYKDYTFGDYNQYYQTAQAPPLRIEKTFATGWSMTAMVLSITPMKLKSDVFEWK